MCNESANEWNFFALLFSIGDDAVYETKFFIKKIVCHFLITQNFLVRIEFHADVHNNSIQIIYYLWTLHAHLRLLHKFFTIFKRQKQQPKIILYTGVSSVKLVFILIIALECWKFISIYTLETCHSHICWYILPHNTPLY